MEKEWKEYPVLHLSLAGGKHLEKEQQEDYLGNMLRREEEHLGFERKSTSPNDRFSDLMHYCYEKYGRQVVVLIDEYDAPLHDVVHEKELLLVLRNTMRNFYSPLKDCEPLLRFVFLTGYVDTAIDAGRVVIADISACLKSRDACREFGGVKNSAYIY